MCHWEGEGDKDKALNVFLVVDNKKSTQNKDFFFQAFNFLLHGIFNFRIQIYTTTDTHQN